MRFWIAIPSSLIEGSRTKAEQTLKVGTIARAAAIFRVERIFVFIDPKYPKPRAAGFISRILKYMATPPYLRRKLHPISEDLEEAGLLPPLGIPPHRRSPDVKPGEVREAVLEVVGGRLYADVGMGRLIEYSGHGRSGARVTVVVRERDGDHYCEPAEPPPGEYWGYEVKTVEDLVKLIRSSKPGSTIATSRHGTPLTEEWDHIVRAAHGRGSILVAFGAPRRGLLDMYSRKTLEGLGARVIDFIPNQGVDSMRTEEAVFTVLATIEIAGIIGRQ